MLGWRSSDIAAGRSWVARGLGWWGECGGDEGGGWGLSAERQASVNGVDLRHRPASRPCHAGRNPYTPLRLSYAGGQSGELVNIHISFRSPQVSHVVPHRRPQSDRKFCFPSLCEDHTGLTALPETIASLLILRTFSPVNFCPFADFCRPECGANFRSLPSFRDTEGVPVRQRLVRGGNKDIIIIEGLNDPGQRTTARNRFLLGCPSLERRNPVPAGTGLRNIPQQACGECVRLNLRGFRILRQPATSRQKPFVLLPLCMPVRSVTCRSAPLTFSLNTLSLRPLRSFESCMVWRLPS